MFNLPNQVAKIFLAIWGVIADILFSYELSEYLKKYLKTIDNG